MMKSFLCNNQIEMIITKWNGFDVNITNGVNKTISYGLMQLADI
jgi:hypothetical protein